MRKYERLLGIIVFCSESPLIYVSIVIKHRNCEGKYIYKVA